MCRCVEDHVYVGLGNGSLAVFDTEDPGTYPGNGSMDVAGSCTVQVVVSLNTSWL